MRKSIAVSPKKKVGRPATGRDPHVTARFPESLVAEVEAWAASNAATRSEAIRRLVELGLTVKVPQRKNTSQTDRAKEMAAGAIDKLTDGSATTDERAERKRHLLKGPEEFRSVRVDRKGKA